MIGLTGEWLVSAGIIEVRGEKAVESLQITGDRGEKKGFFAKDALGEALRRGQ
jgi:hypothetical protein